MQYHIVDVFTDKIFKGNPAGVVFLEEWISADILQSIATENNLSETAFAVKQDGYYDLRWFTPTLEVDLCGHATIATAFILFEEIEKDKTEIKFKTMSGEISVTKEEDIFYLNFPSRPVNICPTYQVFEESFGIKPKATYKAVDFLVLLDSEEEVRSIKPDYLKLMNLKKEAGLSDDSFGVIITAKGNDCDFVSRFFAPNAGINEDPVTGRAHCSLIPFWSNILGKTKLEAKQLSKRGGYIYCEDLGKRVKIGGKVAKYLSGNIAIGDN